MKKNILIISIYYPPIPSIASNRIYSFSKYLDKDKYNVFVHTISSDYDIKEDLDIKVSREKNDILFKSAVFDKRTNLFFHYLKVIYNKLLNLLFSYPYRAWLKRSEKSLQKLIKDQNIDLILSSFSPVETHLLALKLKDKFPDIKWIADFRDEMSQNPFIDKRTKKVYEALEREIFSKVDGVSSVSKPILDEFKRVPTNKKILFQEIRNGYDFELDPPSKQNKLFTISYIGNFYAQRNPNNFLKALDELYKSGLIKDIRVDFIGVKTHFEIPKSLKDVVFVQDSISHESAIKKMKESDLLLLIHPNNGKKGVYTGKLFEYLASLNPILALVDKEDVAAKLIKKCKAGYIADFDDIKEIKIMIQKAYHDKKSDKEFNPDIDHIKLHHRKEQTKRLQKLIKELLS